MILVRVGGIAADPYTGFHDPMEASIFFCSFLSFSVIVEGLSPTWEEYCGRDTQYLQSMEKVLEHEFGSGEDGNGLELYFGVSERQPDGKVLVTVACKPFCLRGSTM